jgi:hypothetical protein
MIIMKKLTKREEADLAYKREVMEDLMILVRDDDFMKVAQVRAKWRMKMDAIGLIWSGSPGIMKEGEGYPERGVLGYVGFQGMRDWDGAIEEEVRRQNEDINRKAGKSGGGLLKRGKRK